MNESHSDAFVFFGATGDLASRRFSRRCRQWPGVDTSTCPSLESDALLRIWPRSSTAPGRVLKSVGALTRGRSRNS